jgi:NAD(P)-dependent dehydrogenase (short-subunit alcohol dehydrogenase family)
MGTYGARYKGHNTVGDARIARTVTKWELNMFDFKGKTAIITGASRGIGAATARKFAQYGANVVLLARSETAVAELAGELGPLALGVPCDISRYWEVAKAVDAAIATFGRIDILVNNAGALEPISHLTTSDPDAWGHTIDINLKGVYNGIRAVVPHMEGHGGGTVITVTSGAAHNPYEGWSHYCAAKAGVEMMMSSLHAENATKGIRALSISPGTVATQMQREIKASGVNPVSTMDVSDHFPPEWPAMAMAWMCTEDSDMHRGGVVSMRDPVLQKRLGLTS